MRILSSTAISQVCDRHGPKTKSKKKGGMVLSLRIFDTCKGSRISLLWKYPFGNFQKNRQGKKDERGCLGVDFHSPDKR